MSIAATPEELERSKVLMKNSSITNQQLEQQSRAAIKAWCDDPSVQLEFSPKDGGKWLAMQGREEFYTKSYYYRIAKPRKWYRVAKLTLGTATVSNEVQEDATESSFNFVEWLDERKYYD